MKLGELGEVSFGMLKLGELGEPSSLHSKLVKKIKIEFLTFQVDCPDGNLGKDKILDMYSMILPVKNATVFVDQIFRIFDKDGNGSIDFKVKKK